MKNDNNIPSGLPGGGPLQLKRHTGGFWEVTGKAKAMINERLGGRTRIEHSDESGGSSRA